MEGVREVSEFENVRSSHVSHLYSQQKKTTKEINL